MRLAIAAIALAGCDIVFPTHDPPEPSQVHAKLVERRVTNDTSHRPQLSSAASTATAQVRIGDDGPVAVDVVDGELSFDRPTPSTPYRVVLTRHALDIEIQSAAASVTMAFNVAGRDGTPVTKATKIAVPADPPGQRSALYSTGQWSLTYPIGGTSFDWRDAPPATEVPVGLLSGAAGDELFYLRYDTPTPTSGAVSTTKLLAMTRDTSEMVDGGTIDLTAAPPALPSDRCAKVLAPREPEFRRFMVAAPGLAPSEDFEIAQFPAPQLGMFGGIFLFQSLDDGTAPFDQTVSYPQLEPDYPLVATAAVFGSRQFTGHGADKALDVTTELRWYDQLPADCSTTLVLSTDLCPAAQPSLGGKPLVGEETPFALPATDPELRWDCDGTADGYVLIVYEVTTTPEGGTQLVPVRMLVTADSHALIDRTMFAAGKVYMFAISSYRGFPGARDGDFATYAAFPSATSTIYTGSFIVPE